MRNLRAKLAAGLLVLAPVIIAAQTNADEVLLFTYFRNNIQDGVHLATSTNGSHFVALNEDKAIFTPPPWPGQNLTRDASLLFHDGKFRMVWTSAWKGRLFGYAESADLVKWSEPRQVKPFREGLPVEDQPDNIWAPEVNWDPLKQDYFILFASTTPRERNDEDDSNNNGKRGSQYDTDALGPFYEAEVKLASGQQARTRFVPFSNIGRWYRDGAPKPERHSRAFSYAVWLQDSASPAFAKAAEEQRRLQDLVMNSVDFVLIGDDKSERDHKLKGTSNSGPFNARTYRHAGGGGWFSYELKVPTEQPAQLVVTYWGGERDKRVFDVLANDHLLATQTLLQDKPGEFFEVRYAVPFDLIQNKTDALGRKVDTITVKFHAHPGNTAGGVFGLRVVKTEERATSPESNNHTK